MKIENQSLSEKVPRLAVFNPKGGVGKTAITLNLALTHGYGVITNDRNTNIDSVLNASVCKVLKDQEQIPVLPDSWPVIYDFAGYPDKRFLTILSVIETKGFLLIPILPQKENLQNNMNFIQEIQNPPFFYIRNDVRLQNLHVKTVDIKTDDEVRKPKPLLKLAYLLFLKGQIRIIIGVINTNNRNF